MECFAAAPDIVQPIALDFDAKGRLLVVESHTHFRPANYTGPKFDRIRMLEDTDGDGKADRFTTFYEGTTYTMDLAVHPDGSVYVATRNEILRVRDSDGDGKADEKKRIVFLETNGNYPHNGLSGLSFDARGDLNFGIGENLGEPYKLIGSDGGTLTGGGEGGNIFHCTADGKKLRRVATGFWNPFGSCRDIYGRLFVVDNDPDASPPCRLVHVVEGGDYGFQFRYGRAGRHPFQAWNGELPGTLPYVAGTGESPCEVISYESDGLPDEYRGDLLVPAWADHRVERYTLKPTGRELQRRTQAIHSGRERLLPVRSDGRPGRLALRQRLGVAQLRAARQGRDVAHHVEGSQTRAAAEGPEGSDSQQGSQGARGRGTRVGTQRGRSHTTPGTLHLQRCSRSCHGTHHTHADQLAAGGVAPNRPHRS